MFCAKKGDVKKFKFLYIPVCILGIGKNGQKGQTSAREAYWRTSRADFALSKKENFTEKLKLLSFSYLSYFFNRH